jgi:H+/Cl- antiporter ClcA
MSDESGPPTIAQGTDRERARELLRALVVAAGVGLPVSLAAFGFLALTPAIETVLWTTIPENLGFSGTAWWWILLVPTVGGLIAGLVVRHLPGGGGHEPIKGFTPDPVLPRAIPGVVLAALASLSFGAVLGPEAPLLALGSALGLWFARIGRLSGEVAPLAAAAGLFASISALFGNPLLAAFLVLEAVGMAGLTAPLAAVLLPGMLSAAIGYLLITGIRSWSGIEISGFPALDLPAYPTVVLMDLLWAVVLGIVLAALVAAVRVVAERAHALTSTHPGFMAPGAGLLVGVAALLFAAGSGEHADLVLFSGESSTPTVVSSGASWGAGVLALLLLLKSLAYAISLGSLFRGGPVFPALFLGATVGVLLSELVPDVSLTASVVVGMAAATSAMLRLPLSAVLLAVLLGGSTALEATSLALIASVVAFVATRVLERSRAARSPAPAQPSSPPG